MWLRKLWEGLLSIFDREDDPQEDHTQSSERRADNLPDTPTPPLPEILSVEEKEPLLWYPNRVKDPELEKLSMKTRGYYKNHFPEGAVVHFTAGRSRDKKRGGKRNASTHFLQGVRSLKYAVKKGSYCYFLIDRDGNVFQNFPLNRWGYHAGKSEYPGLTDTVSNELVGIEVMNAGKLTKVSDGKYKQYFTNISKGDKYFTDDEVEYWEETENIQAGYYHKFSDKQTAALVDLVLWMDKQSQAFKLEYVVGHDEVAPDRKNDPGGSIGMPMSLFRELLQDIKKGEAL